MEDRELLKETHPGFTVKCDKCGSGRVYVDSDVGFSDTSGAWGGVSLKCDDCGNSVEIWSTL